MESSTWLWIIVGLVVLALVIAAVLAGRKKKQQRDRTRAQELREQASAHATGVQRHEARAKETEADAARARAEADRKRAEAERLEAEARERQGAASEVREKHEEHLRRADELDPDVDHKSADYDPHRGDRTVDDRQGDQVGYEATSSSSDTSSSYSDTDRSGSSAIPEQSTHGDGTLADDDTGRHRA